MNNVHTKNIPKTLDKLCALFDAELERQIVVQRMCQTQGDAARQSDMTSLQSCTEALVVLMEDALHAEKVRIEILHWIVDHYRLPVKEHTLTDLIAVVPQPRHQSDHRKDDSPAVQWPVDVEEQTNC